MDIAIDNNLRGSKLVLVCVLLLLSSIISNAQVTIGHPDYTVYANRDYILSNQFLHVEEGPRGLIYLAYGGGIQEYDGIAWRDVDTGEPSAIRSFAIDQNTGIIYFGKPGELSYVRPNQNGLWKHHSINKELNQDLGKFSDIWYVELIENYVYFQSYEKLFRYNLATKEIKVWESETFFSRPGVIENQFYIGQKEKGLYSVIEDSLVLLSDHERLKGMSFYNIVPFNDTLLLITSKDKAVMVNSRTYEPENKMDVLLKKLEPALINQAYYIVTLQNKKFAVSTVHNGVYILDSMLNIQNNYNKEDGFPTNFSWHVAQSKNGMIWAALDNGLVKISSEDHFIFFDKSSYLDNRIMTLLKHGPILYLGTSEGLFKLNISDINGITLENTNIKASVWSIKEFVKSNNDTVILAATTDGVWEQNNETFKLIQKQTSTGYLLQSKVYSERLYYRFNRGISYIENKAGKWSEPVNVSDLKMGLGLIEDSVGNLWVSTWMRGAYLISRDSLKKGSFHTKEIFIDSSGFTIYDGLLLNDTVVLSTSKGFYSFNKDSSRFLPDSTLFDFNDKGMIPGKVHGINDNEFWVEGFKDKSSYLFYYYKENNTFKRNEKDLPFFKDKDITQIYHESGDRLWLGIDGRLVLFKNLNNYREITSSVNVLIRNVSINNDSVIFHGTNYTLAGDSNVVMNLESFSKTIKPIAYEFNNISFKFASPCFNKEWSNQFSFMLEGYEKDWSEWSPQSKKEYTNLREGDYTFKVKARNIFDKESEPYSYNFTIKPPFTRSLLAYIMYVMFFLFSIGFAVWRFVNKHKREKDKLESIITQRTSKILTQKEKIENQAKELGYINIQLNQLSIVASKVDNPVVICNINGQIEWVNDSYCKYFNKNQKEMIKNNSNLLDTCFNPNIGKYFETCIKEKRAITYTVNASKVRKNKELWMQTTLTPIVNSGDEVINIIAISSDITYLHELNNTRDIVMSVITHDLKSPLLAFKMITGNLLKQLQRVNQEKLELSLNELYSHSSEIYEFLQYLSEWLKAQSGSLTFFPHVFDLSKILDEVLSLFRMSASHKRIRLENQLAVSTKVFADENMIKTVFRNLISNAIKFSKTGDLVAISSERKNGSVVVSVSDGGKGIPKDKKDKLFSIDQSNGLGLIICKEFVQKNKGEIWVEDKEKGTLIKFSIPVN